jgi:amino acid adenylation domain-containing protein
MLQRTPPLEQAVLAAMSAASIDKTAAITSSTEILQLVDSLGFFIALTDIQDATGLSLDPAQLLQVLRCRSIADMVATLESISSTLESVPQTSAAELPVLPQTEWNQVIHSFNATRIDYPREKLIHELFEEQVERTPHAVAVLCEGQSLTYDLLNREANQLARHLRRKGAGPDRLVALCLQRSIDMLVGVLGVLKAGAAYVPLDPTNPGERLRHVLANAAPSVLLTHGEVGDVLPTIGAEIVHLDKDREEIAQHSERNMDSRSLQLSSRNLAYVMYTSGSTGKPKGVAVEHRNVVNYVVYALRQYDMAAGAGSAVCTSISFDLMLTGLYPTLLCGRTVRLCAERHGMPELERELFRSRNLAPLKLTPSHLGLVEQALKSGQLAGRVRALVLGGEQLYASMVQLWRKHAPETRIFNEYGPTETTVGCVVQEIDDEVAGVVPIGKPIANTQIYILDGLLQPVPIAAPGEIYVGGAGVARGYLHRPGLTSERFIADPFSGDPQARLYKTGDMGRWRPDGTIEYLGRSDDQVKIRGFRVELAEVEAHLTQHARVSQATVIAREDDTGEKQLVAYLVAERRSGHASEATENDFEQQLVKQLREHLKAQLPEYMIPASWVVLRQLPLTPNGKVDRRALARTSSPSVAVEPVPVPRSYGTLQTSCRSDFNPNGT